MASEPSPSTQQLVSADLLTLSYRVVGKFMVGHTGVMGMMNDTLNSFMEILDAKLARISMPTKLVDHFEVVRIVKPQVFAVCLNRREDIGPQALARGGYVRLSEYPVRITNQVFEIEGLLEWAGRFDFSTIMVEGTREFVPLYDATVTAILIPAMKIESPAILFNRRYVDLLGLKGQRVKEEETKT
jgi:hypothetical protein